MGPVRARDPDFGEAAYARIRGDIVHGRLAPGRKLGLGGLRQIYGAGPSTLREALHRLGSEGFVEAEGHRGFRVAPVSNDDLSEIAELRVLLERQAIVDSFAAGDLDWEGQVVGAHHKLAVLEARMLAGEAVDAERWKRCDREFHRALIGACGSVALLEAYASVYDRYLRYQMVAVVFRGAMAVDQHRQLLASALARDAASACRVLEAHVRECVDHVVATRRLAPYAVSHPAAAMPAGWPEPVGARAHRRIRADILRGVLPPGCKLKLDVLRDRYGTSIGTLRETLSRLVAERLVVAEGQRGFEVVHFSAAELRELAALRLLLEGHALAQAFCAADIDWEARVVAAHHQLARTEERLGKGEIQALDVWRGLDSAFHQALISACGSRALMATHAAVFDRYVRYQNMALGFRGEIAVREHRALVECALQRDVTGARAVLAQHIEGGVVHALAGDAIG